MRIDLRSCDDWIAVYKDGAKVFENHSCGLREGLRALGVPFESVELEVDDITLTTPEGEDAFPEKLGA